MNPEIDNYLSEGCGRCQLVGTPQCKVHNWQPELKLLRQILLDTGLTEELKWSMPCYTYKKSNIVMLAAFKEHCSISFFKGALLKDTHGILEKPGENSQSSRRIPFTNVQRIVELEATIKAYIFEALEAEKAGLKVNFKKISEIKLPEEFETILNENLALETAFKALTPGRQRAYILHFSSPKQSATRISRINKCTPQILSGKGLNDK
ncbi:DUF1801 domain-containing protein [uncultured Draconibacterium sp.]|uniref:YdeI/OmpD-associated family protein n=1 Tax=uncultured Draconibacterium sp. TaxID=1573823 RepID=UPI0032180427